MVDNFSDIVNDDVQQELRDMNSIVFPHGSFVAYAGLDNIETIFNVPMFGNRDILRWEAERDLERKLMTESGIRIPKKINNPNEIDGTVMVKFPGARGGRDCLRGVVPPDQVGPAAEEPDGQGTVGLRRTGWVCHCLLLGAAGRNLQPRTEERQEEAQGQSVRRQGGSRDHTEQRRAVGRGLRRAHPFCN